MTLRLTLSVLFLLPAVSLAVPAQTTLRGELFDSLRTNRPIVGATVLIVGTAKRATTDAAGRFSFEDAPTGPFTLAYGAPWLDSLGIDYLRAEIVDSRTAGIVRLATPSMATLEGMLCGAAMAPGRSVIVGEVRGPSGEAFGEMLVWASWRALSVEGIRVRDDLVATTDTTDTRGSFALCGIPVGEPVFIRSEADSVATGEIQYLASVGVQRLDLYAASPAEVVDISGRVELAAGDSSAPRASGILLVLSDDSTITARTDSSGTFRLRVPRRSSSLIARSPGFPPSRHTIPLQSAEDGLWTIKLQKPPVQLDAVAVVGERYARERQDFEKRRALGTGRFIVEDEIKRFPIFTPTAIQSLVPRVRAVGRSRYAVLKVRSGFGFCDPRWFEDGIDGGRLDAIAQDLLLQRAKRVEIYSAAEAPPKFNDNDGCGAIVVWTR